jgi:hypothetical protein
VKNEGNEKFRLNKENYGSQVERLLEF